MFNCLDSLGIKIERLSEQMGNLKLNMSDCDLELSSASPSKPSGPLGPSESLSPLSVRKQRANGQPDGFSIKEMIQNFNQLTVDLNQMKTTQTTIVLIVNQILDKVNRLESNSAIDPKVEVKKPQIKKRQSGKNHQDDYSQPEEKENCQQSTIKTEKQKVTSKRLSKRNPLSDLSTQDNVTSVKCNIDKDTSCTIVYDRNASLSTSMTLRPLRRRTDYRPFC